MAGIGKDYSTLEWQQISKLSGYSSQSLVAGYIFPCTCSKYYIVKHGQKKLPYSGPENPGMLIFRIIITVYTMEAND